MNRKLYIDSFDVAIPELKVLNNIQDIHNIISEYSFNSEPVDLNLDVRNLNEKTLTSMLKFIEEYKGSITMVINDPVPLTILSRFIEIKKLSNIKYEDLRIKAYNNLGRNLKTKVFSFFDIELDKLT